jgi:hypothetical protein
VNLGFVSAYLLVRGGEAAVVDTGVTGSDGAISTALTGIGLARRTTRSSRPCVRTSA